MDVGVWGQAASASGTPVSSFHSLHADTPLYLILKALSNLVQSLSEWLGAHVTRAQLTTIPTEASGSCS